ncbi:hypothetical protein INT48_000869 [Thamnidium elegans]|uniref:Uncharacterized protein n=1 Tax=Thamnidium elegans TaxID=101142 RepID=A0A8H7SW12_9FUNG|nr:hypothetical protein INT48_000869 [Thamnidium elegans]
MLFWNHITGFFNRKSKQEKVLPPASSQVPQVTEHCSESETQTTTSSTVSNEEVPSIPVVPTPLPEVEFEQSRNLLQLDFFGSAQEKENRLASFPKFDYLLEANKKTPIDNTLKKSGKSSITLRHRISLYRPSQQKVVKRSLSTPDIYNSK